MTSENGVGCWRRQEHLLERALLAFCVFLLVFASAGCIDVNLGKDLVLARAPPQEYVSVEKAVLQHKFNVEILPNITLEDTYNEQNVTFEVFGGTEALILRVDVTMLFTFNVTELLELLLEKLPLADEYIEELEDVLQQRYVNVTLETPAGELAYQETYTFTGTYCGLLEDPEPGSWHLRVRAVGVGSRMLEDLTAEQPYEYSSDEYCVEVYAKEPQR